MTIAIAVRSAKSSSGTQDITTTDLLGQTPKGVIFLYSRSAADGTVTADSGGSFGAADGTNQFACAAFVSDAETSTQPMGGTGKTNKCIMDLWLDGVVQMRSEAAFVSFIANGVRVNWTTAQPDGWLITAVFFAGDEVSFKCGTVNVQNGTVVSGIGFQSDVIMMASPNRPFDGVVTAVGRGMWSIGGNAWLAGTRRGALGHQWAWTPTGQRLTWISGGVSESAGAVFDVSGYGIKATRSSDGFTVQSDVAGVSDVEWGYVCFAAHGGTCGHIGVTASTGDQSVTGLGFTPELLFLFCGQNATDDAPAFIGTIAIAAATAIKTGGFAMSSRSDGAGPSISVPTIEKSTAFEDKIRMLSPTGTENARCTVSSIFDGGFTLNFTDAPDSSWNWGFLAFGPTGSPSPPPTPVAGNQGWIIE